MEVYSGFFAIKQYPDKTLEPFISWAVCDKESKAPGYSLTLYTEEGKKLMAKNPVEILHEQYNWSPHITSKPIQNAIYNIKANKTPQKGIAVIQSILKDTIAAHPEFQGRRFTGTKVSFTVLCNGKITDIKVEGTKSNPHLTEVIQQQLSNLPGEWFPALAHPSDVLELMDPSEETDKIKIRVNSEVSFSLL